MEDRNQQFLSDGRVVGAAISRGEPRASAALPRHRNSIDKRICDE